MKNRFAVFVLAMFMLVGLACQLTQPAQPDPTTAPVATLPPLVQATAPVATGVIAPTQPPLVSQIAPQIVTQVYSEEALPRYAISLEYPVLQGSDGPAVENFNAIAQAQVDTLVAEFQTGLMGDMIITPDAFAPVPQNSLGSTVTVWYNDHGLVSIYAANSQYFYGAAHPNPFSSVINYSLPMQRGLTLADLFRPGTEYLQTIAKYCINTLRQEEWFSFEDGAQPTELNYQMWNITPEGLRITFDPYQVAAYAAGYQSVTVPWSELTELIDPAGPLAEVVE